jgi:hypothetical protein
LAKLIAKEDGDGWSIVNYDVVHTIEAAQDWMNNA